MTTTTAPLAQHRAATPAGSGPRTTTFAGLAYDAFDALAAAQFWAAALRVDLSPGASPARAELVAGSTAGIPPLVFRQVTDGRALTTPLHLQLTTNDLDAESRRLQQLGARRVGSVNDHGRRSMTLIDPEGNAFDLVEGSGLGR
ncbi:VOC family protein [Actinotalea sp. C106]|uniref:VOC family protein n=1 Tax=Actinotalea sp. C106 TaxID=2908644 RepID=UPI002029255E|nr:VOC family protein [Actinotalea sp. C106]